MHATTTAAPRQSDATATLNFATQENEITLDDLPIEGAVPRWLAGSLVRNGPAKYEVGADSMRHLFDGLAMLHSFSFEDGRVSYANRFLEGETRRASREQGRIVFSEFGTDPCRSIFRRVQTLFAPGFGDNANVNVGRLGDRLIAMTETPMPVEFDKRTLAAAGVPYTAPGQLTTAHPHHDRATGAMLNYAAKLGARTTYRFFTVGPEDTTPRVLSTIPVRRPAYMHSFGLTERWFVLAEFPLVVNPPSIPLSGKPYIENYKWKPERGTRFILVDRETGEATDGFEAPACFGFHHLNAFDDGDEVVVDISVYEDASIIDALYLDRLRDAAARSANAAKMRPELRRFRLSLGDKSVRTEPLVEGGLELARINYSRCNERYRYAWGLDAGGSDWLDRIVRVDVEQRTRSEWTEDGCYPGEPVFVASPGAEAEDDGVLLSVVLDSRRETSFLLVLDAHDMTELARAEVPQHIPFGFHGQFVSG